MRFSFTLLVTLSSICTLANADTNAQSMDEVITIAKRSSERFETVGNIAKLSEEELRNISALTIQGVLVRVPGVNLQQGNGQEYLPAVRSPVLTGGGACGAFLTAQDNIPLKAAGFCNVNELFESYSEIAQQVEVIRGPGTALYGSNAMHGVINVVLPSVPDESESGFTTEFGANNYRRNTLGGAMVSGDHGFMANVTAAHDGGFRDDAYYDQQKMQLRHEYSGALLNIATSFTATNLNQETAGYIEGKDAYLDPHLVTTNPNPEAYRDAESYRLYSRITADLGGDKQVVITPYIRRTDMEFMQHFLPGTPVEENGQKSAGMLLTYYDQYFSTLDLISGVDVEWTDGYLKQTQASPAANPFPQGKQYDYQVDALQLSPYFNLEYALTSRLVATAGIRYEMMSYDYDNKMLDGRTNDQGAPCPGGCRYSRPADRDDVFRNWSQAIGMKFSITDNLLTYVKIAQGFRAPQATELYRLQGDQVVADLDSEKINSVEIGLRGRSELFTYEVNAYRMDKRNVIFQDSLRFNIDDGETSHLGYELQLRYQASESWDFALAANYGDHYYTNDQLSGGVNINRNQVDTAPKRFGTAQIGLQMADSLRGELEFVHTGGYYTNPENTDFYDGHDLINFRMQWQPMENFEMGFRLLNLTDELYADRADYNFGEPRYFPGEPRSAYVNATFKF